MNRTRTTWLVTPDVTWAGTEVSAPTPPEALDSMAALLFRVADYLTRGRSKEGVILVDELAADRLGLAEAATDDGRRQRALDAAAGQGWRHSAKVGVWTQFWGQGRPTVHVGQLDMIRADAHQRGDAMSWPFEASWLGDTCAWLQHWHHLTGVPWQAGPAVMGLEMMHRTITPYRVQDPQGNRWKQNAVVKVDDSTPPDASEPVWSPRMWNRDELAPYAHSYDRRRAGITAAGSAKLCPARLTRSWRNEFDPKRAGWWQVSIPPWNVRELPHPMGPWPVWSRQWVTTATLDLAAELAREGVLDMPEVIDSLTGPARTLLQPWQQTIEKAYTEPVSEQYPAEDQHAIREALKEAGTRGIGMLAYRRGDTTSSIYRPDWFHAINATKRCNAWRKCWGIWKAEKRAPLAFDDDAVWYASDHADPYEAAPTDLNLREDRPGAYRVQPEKTKELTA